MLEKTKRQPITGPQLAYLSLLLANAGEKRRIEVKRKLRIAGDLTRLDSLKAAAAIAMLRGGRRNG